MREVIKIKTYIQAHPGYRIIYYSQDGNPKLWAGDEVILWGVCEQGEVWPITLEGIGLAYDNGKGVLMPSGSVEFPHDRVFVSLAAALAQIEAGEWAP